MEKCKIVIARSNGMPVFCGEELMGGKRYCLKCQISNCKVIFLDNNELSLAMYSQEYPENWKLICDSLSNEDKKHE